VFSDTTVFFLLFDGGGLGWTGCLGSMTLAFSFKP